MPTPLLENAATLSSVTVAVALMSSAPTVRTYGSSPGFVTVPSGPWFPAETTTRIPAFHTRSTASSSGSPVTSCAESVPKERLRIRIPNRSRFATIHCRPAITDETSVAPSQPATLTETMLASGAAPV